MNKLGIDLQKVFIVAIAEGLHDTPDTMKRFSVTPAAGGSFIVHRENGDSAVVIKGGVPYYPDGDAYLPDVADGLEYLWATFTKMNILTHANFLETYGRFNITGKVRLEQDGKAIDAVTFLKQFHGHTAEKPHGHDAHGAAASGTPAAVGA